MNTIQNKIKISPEDKIKILALSRIDGFGPRRILTCLNKFGSVDEIQRIKHDILMKFIPGHLIYYLKKDKYLKGIDNYIKDLERKNI